MRKMSLLVQNRLKILFKDKILWGLFAVILLFFAFILSSLIEHMDTGSRMPIAVVDEDNSVISHTIVERLKIQEALSVQEEERNTALELLKDARVEVVYVFPEGFEEQLEQNELEHIIMAYHLEGSHAGKILSDIVAGEMMYEVTLVKTYQLYENKLEEHKMDLQEAMEEIKANAQVMLENDTSFEPIMNVQLVKELDETLESDIDNTLIYKQVIISMLAIFLAFFLLFAATSMIKDKEMGIEDRLMTIESSTGRLLISHMVSLLIVGLFVSTIFSGLITIRFGMFSWISLLSLFLLLMMYILSLACFFVMCSAWLHQVVTLQVTGASVLIVFSVLGGSFMNLGFGSQALLLQLSKLIPNYWFGRGFSEWMLHGDLLRMGETALLPLFMLSLTFFGISFSYSKWKSF